jgi:DNA repair exonuclease SbcCD ATPase subunit
MSERFWSLDETARDVRRLIDDRDELKLRLDEALATIESQESKNNNIDELLSDKEQADAQIVRLTEEINTAVARHCGLCAKIDELTAQRDLLIAYAAMNRADLDDTMFFEEFLAIAKYFGHDHDKETVYQFMDRLEKDAFAMCPEFKRAGEPE